jgi:hypothetical protein
MRLLGDLGVTARDVEKTLETNFNLATKWGCILLLDEADVFLAKRSKEDFVRNGLVAGEYITRCGTHIRRDYANGCQHFYVFWNIMLEFYS